MDFIGKKRIKMPEQPKNNYANQSDRLNVMIKETVTKIDNYEVEIRNIDSGLKNAKASLQNVPGVQNAVDAIDQEIQTNYGRGRDLNRVRQYENEFFQALANDYIKFSQAVNQLKEPSSVKQQLQITDGQSTQTDQSVNQPQQNDQSNFVQNN